jgi:hypothetical protein
VVPALRRARRLRHRHGPAGQLAHLSDEDRRAVERWARATFGRLMHLPVAALKRLAADLSTGPDGGGFVGDASLDADPDRAAAAEGAGPQRAAAAEGAGPDRASTAELGR